MNRFVSRIAKVARSKSATDAGPFVAMVKVRTEKVVFFFGAIKRSATFVEPFASPEHLVRIHVRMGISGWYTRSVPIDGRFPPYVVFFRRP